ncbi:AraC family transcriptional regulator, positive regulator of tynA and feaB [Paraburkholderia sacchari]|uniref:AraC-like ligand-binding domain-containing protein n=1 Tax=Paraburkholderia sacchari TaxID=159450 RepID=UPI0039A5E0C0
MTAATGESTGLMHVSTDTVRARDKVAFWTDQVCKHLVQVDCTSVVEPEQFHAAISLRKVDKVNLSRITAGGQQVARTPQLMAKADEEYLLLNIQRNGISGLEQDGRLATLKPGDMALYTSTRRYDLSFNEDFSQTVLIFPADALRLKIPGIDALTATVLNNQNPAAQLFAQVANNYLQTDFDALPPAAAVHAGEALTQLLAATVAAFTPVAETQLSNLALFHLARIRQYVADHLRDPELSVNTVSQALRISPAHIHRLFEGESQTFSAWLWSCRLLACKADLENCVKAHFTISEIAFQNGFNNSSHFSRTFRAKFGMTPREFRERCLSATSERTRQQRRER